MINRDNRPLRIVADNRKKITIGYKTGKGHPKSANHFVIRHPETKECWFPEIETLYGENPVELIVSFPTNNMRDFYNDTFALWGKNNVKKRNCDGVECVHCVAETIGDNKYEGGEVSECVCRKFALKDSDKPIAPPCTCDIWLKAYILHPDTLLPISPMCYMFSNHGINSSDNLFGELDRYTKFVGYPFRLSVKQVKKPDGVIFYLFELRPYVTGELLIEYNLKATSKLKEIVGYTAPETALALVESPIEDVTYEEIVGKDTEMTPAQKKRFVVKYDSLRDSWDSKVKFDEVIFDEFELTDPTRVNTIELATEIINFITEYK